MVEVITYQFLHLVKVKNKQQQEKNDCLFSNIFFNFKIVLNDAVQQGIF